MNEQSEQISETPATDTRPKKADPLVPTPTEHLVGNQYVAASAELPHTAPSGGDFYAAFPVRDGTGDIGVVMGDVAGHGPEKTEQAQQLLAEITDKISNGAAPAEALAETNAALAEDPNFDGFATAFAGRIEGDTGHLSYACAGHEPAMIAPQNPVPDDGVEELKTTGPPIGAADPSLARYRDQGATIPDGGTLLLYTDGVSQARAPLGHEWLGIGRLKYLFTRFAGLRPQRLVSKLIGHALAFSRGRRSDDMAAMAVRRRA